MSLGLIDYSHVKFSINNMEIISLILNTSYWFASGQNENRYYLIAFYENMCPLLLFCSCPDKWRIKDIEKEAIGTFAQSKT